MKDTDHIPMFSVIVPIYDVERYLDQCIDSVLSQEYTNYELLLIVDETSHDKCLDIAIGYASEHLNVFVYKRKHAGLGDARNYGVGLAKGKYIIFIDSDDFLDDKLYFGALSEIIEDEKPDYVVSGYKKCDETGKQRQKIKKHLASSVGAMTSKEKITVMMETGEFYYTAWAKAIRKDFLMGNKIDFAEGYSEDMDWTGKILNKAETISILDSDAYVYRQREESLSAHVNIKKCLDTVARIKSWKKQLTGNGSRYEMAQYGLMEYQYYLLRAYVNGLTKEEQTTVLKKMEELEDLKNKGNFRKLRACRCICNVFGQNIGSKLLYRYILLR